MAGLDFYRDLLRDGLSADEDWAAEVKEDARQIIKESGAEIPEDSDGWDDLCRALTKAKIEAIGAIMAQRMGKLYVSPEGPFHTTVLPWQLTAPAPVRTRQRSRSAQPESPVTFSDAAERFLESRQRDPSASWTQQTCLQAEATFRLFRDYTDNPELSTVTRETAAGYLEAISRLHPDYGRSPNTKSLSLWQLLERHSAAKGQTGLSNRTINRHATALRQLWRWALRQGLLPDGANNPFDDQTRPTGRQSRRGWRPMTTEELNVLFHSPLLTNTKLKERLQPADHSPKTALMWTPLIAVFSGMRLGEICQLRVGDIMNENGITFFSVNEDESQKVKTEASIRRIPVHSELIRCGFLDYVAHVRQQGHNQLFPGLTPQGPDKKLSWYLTKAFSHHRRALGIGSPQVSFHSLRKNVATALERARVPESEAVQILGHEKLSMSYSIYSLGLDLKGLQGVVERISYKDLDITHLQNIGCENVRFRRQNGHQIRQS